MTNESIKQRLGLDKLSLPLTGLAGLVSGIITTMTILDDRIESQAARVAAAQFQLVKDQLRIELKKSVEEGMVPTKLMLEAHTTSPYHEGMPSYVALSMSGLRETLEALRQDVQYLSARIDNLQRHGMGP